MITKGQTTGGRPWVPGQFGSFLALGLPVTERPRPSSGGAQRPWAWDGVGEVSRPSRGGASWPSHTPHVAATHLSLPYPFSVRS